MSLKTNAVRMGNLFRQLNSINDHLDQIMHHLIGVGEPRKNTTAQQAFASPEHVMGQIETAINYAEGSANSLNEKMMALADAVGLHDEKSTKLGHN